MSIDYSIASKTYDNTRDSDDNIIEIMFNNNVFQENSNILDFGCGTGNYLHKISQKYKCKCYGVEPSSGMREKACIKNPELKIMEGNHDTIPFGNNFFDFIYMTDVIHHVPDLDILFGNLSEKVKENGKTCVVTQSWEQIEKRWFNRYFPSLESIEKKRYPDIEKITESAKKHGFVLDKIDIMKYPKKIIVGEHFIKNVEEKNYSMFRLINGVEFNTGLENLKKDMGKTIMQNESGESLVWLHKKTSFAALNNGLHGESRL